MSAQRWDTDESLTYECDSGRYVLYADHQAAMDAARRALETTQEELAIVKSLLSDSAKEIGDLATREAALQDEIARLSRPLEMEIRKRIWLAHGGRTRHLLYGDDGKMDCNVCFKDFKAGTLEELYAWELWDLHNADRDDMDLIRPGEGYPGQGA